MPLSQEFIINRAKCTVSAQENIAGEWGWAGKTVAGWKADMLTLEERRDAEIDALTRLRVCRGELDGKSIALHEVTVVYLT